MSHMKPPQKPRWIPSLQLEFWKHWSAFRTMETFQEYLRFSDSLCLINKVFPDVVFLHFWFIFQIRSISGVWSLASCSGAEGTGDYDGTNHSRPFPLHSLQSRQLYKVVMFVQVGSTRPYLSYPPSPAPLTSLMFQLLQLEMMVHLEKVEAGGRLGMQTGTVELSLMSCGCAHN